MSDTLTKAHIIDAVIEQNGYTRKKSIETVEILLELIIQSLELGEDFLISGFGKFCVKKRQSVEVGTRRQARICCWHQGRLSHFSARGI